MVGIPDKMAARSVAELRSRAANNVQDSLELRPQVGHPWPTMVGRGHPRERRGRFGISQVLSLCWDTASVRLTHRFPKDSAGGMTGLATAPLLWCTAVSRGKDDHHRGPFPHRGGEIYFCWTKFWTDGMNAKSGRHFNSHQARKDGRSHLQS